MRGLIALAGLAVLAMAAGAHASSLNKCIDAQGRITYSNLPCRNAREVRSVEVDPAPTPLQPARVRPAKSVPAPSRDAVRPEPANLRLDTQRTGGKPVAQASQRQCDAIASKLGSVLDKMDQARRQGYTPEQVNTWNEEIQTLERKKQQAGCF